MMTVCPANPLWIFVGFESFREMTIDPFLHAFNGFWTSINGFHKPGSVIVAFVKLIFVNIWSVFFMLMGGIPTIVFLPILAGWLVGLGWVAMRIHGLLSSGVQRVQQSLEKQ